MEWISVKDRLPDNDQEVLIFNAESRLIRKAIYNGEVKEFMYCSCCFGNDIDYWCEFPVMPY